MSRTALARFLVVGGGAAALELGLFQLLVLAGLDPVPANVLSFLVGLVTSFLGYRLWSFAGDHTMPVAGQLGAYVTLALVNSVASSVILHLLVGAGLVPWLAKVCCMGLVAAWNFTILHRVIFRRRPTEPAYDGSTPSTP